MSERTYSVTGMTCDHCVRSVTGALGALPGVGEVVVRLAAGEVDVVADPQPPIDDLRAAIDEAGYELVGAIS